MIEYKIKIDFFTEDSDIRESNLFIESKSKFIYIMVLPINNTRFASESVTQGHPDKVADSISDLVLTAALAFGKQQGTLKLTRVACETLVRRNTIIVAGEIKLIRSDASIVPVKEIPEILDLTKNIFSLVKSIGYTDKFAAGFDVDDKNFNLMYMLEEQSTEIGAIVSNESNIGAGDQGMMFGFACNETPTTMPMPISLAHLITKKLAEVRQSSNTALGPDAKSQVIVDYDSLGDPKKVSQVVISTQHCGDVADIREWLRDQFLPSEIYPQFQALGLDYNDLLNAPDSHLKLNYKGPFEIGGPCADSGLTGRKIIVDTYGGMARHGGGAFSGKDPSKVDRSAAYFLRNIARQIIENGWADRCELRVAYVIGEVKPMFIEPSYKNLKIEESLLMKFLNQQLDQSLSDMLDKYNLWDFDYTQSTNYGHFGRNELPWEISSQ